MARIVRMVALCATFVASSAQSCGERLPGIYRSCAYECAPYEGPTPSECCDKCRSNTDCLGICIAKVPGVGSYPGGQGDIVDGPGHCVVENGVNSSDDDDCHMPLSELELQNGQLIYTRGRSNDLGRPGRCSADPYFRVAGKELVMSGGRSVSSVGDCCDLCASTPGCGGWTVEMAQSPWQCRLFEADFRREPCHKCYSGLKAFAVQV
ncbi:unnamed protein product [Symbiodinium sp. CCMP2456]|nr:unnamed protein product [Symbiodinium sp. CCMP2456]